MIYKKNFLLISLFLSFSFSGIACSFLSTSFCASIYELPSNVIISGKIVAIDDDGISMEVIDVIRGEELRDTIRIWDGTDFYCNGPFSMAASDIGSVSDLLVISIPKITEIENVWDVIGDYRRPSPYGYTVQLRWENDLVKGYLSGNKYEAPESTVYSLAYDLFVESFSDEMVCGDLVNLVDNDGDTYYSNVDCDDSNAMVNPGMNEIPYNGIDDDCNAATLEDDLDQDGFLKIDDCDDTNAEIYPGATEINGNDIDEDCDGEDGVISSTANLDETTIVVFPNPSFDVIETSEGYISSVMDLGGKKLIEGKDSRIDVSGFSPGLYLIEIIINEKTVYRKVLKL